MAPTTLLYAGGCKSENTLKSNSNNLYTEDNKYLHKPLSSWKLIQIKSIMSEYLVASQPSHQITFVTDFFYRCTLP